MVIQLSEGLLAERQAATLQIMPGLGRRQPQLILTDFQQLALGPQGRKTHRWQVATADRQGEGSRRQLHQAGQGTQYLAVLYQVQIIQHQKQRLLQIGQVEQQAIDNRRHRHLNHVLQIAQSLLAKTRHGQGETVDQVGKEARRVIILSREKQPGRVVATLLALFGQRGQRRGLAKAGRGAQQQQTGIGMLGERTLQTRTGYVIGRYPRRGQFGTQKAVNSRILNIVHSQYPWFIMIVVRAIAPLGYAHTNQHPPFK